MAVVNGLGLVFLQTQHQCGNGRKRASTAHKRFRRGDRHDLLHLCQAFRNILPRRLHLFGGRRVGLHDAFRNAHAPHLGGIGSQKLTTGNPHHKLGGAAAQVNDTKRALFLAEVRHRADETQFCFFFPGNHLGTRAWADLAQ